MNNNVVFFCEGGLKLGMGNVYRSLSLAGALLSGKTDSNITFVNSSPDYICDLIENNGFKVVKASPDTIANEICNLMPHLLVIDYLNVEPSFVKMIKDTTKCKIAIIGNLNDANQYADIVVNAIIGTNFSNTKTYNQYGTLWLQGPKYLVLRDEFEAIRNKYHYSNNLKNVLLMFGGSDQKNHTLTCAEILLKSKIYHLDIIVGKAYPYIEELRATLGNNINVTIYHDINNVSQIIQQNDFMYTSPGTALFEANCYGIPAIALFQNDSQREVFGDFYGTCNFDSIDLEQHMIDTYTNYATYKKKLDNFAVGCGKEEIISEILKILN